MKKIISATLMILACISPTKGAVPAGCGGTNVIATCFQTLTCGCLGNGTVTATNCQQQETQRITNSTRKITTFEVWGPSNSTQGYITGLKINSDSGFNATGLTSYGLITFEKPVTSIKIHFSSTMKLLGLKFKFYETSQQLDTYALTGTSQAELQAGMAIDTIGANEYDFTNEFVGFTRRYAYSSCTQCPNCWWQFWVVDQDRCADTVLTAPVVDITTSNAKFLISDNRTTTADPTYKYFANATQSTWSICGGIVYTATITSTAISFNSNLVKFTSANNTQIFSNRMDFRKSNNDLEAGTYTIMITAYLKDRPTPSVSTTFQAMYQSCNQNTLLANPTSINDLKAIVNGGQVCVNLSVWSDSFSTDYSSTSICGAIELASFSFKLSSTQNAADTSMISNGGYSSIDQTQFCVTANSPSQVTANYPNVFIEVKINARLRNYPSVTSYVSFKVGVDEPAQNISISFNGDSTLYYSGSYKSLPQYVATSKNFAYTVNYPAVTSQQGYTVIPQTNYLYPPGIFLQSPTSGLYTLGIVSNTQQACMATAIYIDIAWTVSSSITTTGSSRYYVDYILPTQIQDRWMYAGTVIEVDFMNFTTSLSDASCSGALYDTTTITNSDGTAQSAVSADPIGVRPTFINQFFNIRSQSYNDVNTAKIATVKGYIQGSESFKASSVFNIQILDPCLVATFVDATTGSLIPIAQTKAQSNMFVNLGDSQTQTMSGNCDNASIQFDATCATKYCARSYSIQSAACVTPCSGIDLFQSGGISVSSSTGQVTVNIPALPGGGSLIATYNVIVEEKLLLSKCAADASRKLVFTVQVGCALTDYTLTSISDQIAQLYSAISWTFPLGNAIYAPTIQPSYCSYTHTFSYTANTTILPSQAPVQNQSLVFSMPALTDQTLSGSYPVTITAVISDNSGLVSLTRTTTFNVILSDPCMTTVISLSSPFTNYTAYLNQGGSGNNLPFYNDSASTAVSDPTTCGLEAVIRQTAKPSPSAMNYPNTKSATYIVINPNTVTWSSFYSSLGTYIFTVTATIPRNPSITQSNSFSITLIDPCDFSTVTQPTIPSFNLVWPTPTSKSYIYQPVFPINKQNPTYSCKPNAYYVSATLTSGTTFLDSSTGLTATTISDSQFNITTLNITTELLSYSYVGLGSYSGILTYMYYHGKNVTVGFTIDVTLCVLTHITIGQAWPALTYFGVGLTSSQQFPASIVQTPACGYDLQVSYTINGQLHQSLPYPNNLQVDSTNKNSPIINLSQTSDQLNFGTYLLLLTATSMIPTEYNLPTITSNSVQLNFEMFSCTSYAGSIFFLDPPDLPLSTGTHSINIGSPMQFTFSNFADKVSTDLGVNDACGQISYSLWLNDVLVTSSSQTISFQPSALTGLQNTIQISTTNRSISPAQQIVKIQAYLESNQSLKSDFKYFTVNFVDECLTTSISSNQIQINLSTTVLVPITQSTSNLFTDGVTQKYATSSQYNCGSYQYTLTQTTQTASSSLINHIGVDASSGLISLSPLSVTMVGTHYLDLQVSLSLYPTIKYVQKVVAVVGYCIVNSYTMASAYQSGSSDPLLIEYTITQISQNYTYPQVNFQTPDCGYLQTYTNSSSSTLQIISGQLRDNNQQGDYIFSINQQTNRNLAGHYSVTLRSSIANYNVSGGAPSASITIKIVVYDACRNTILIVGSVTNLEMNVWNWDYTTQSPTANKNYTPVTTFSDSVSNSQNNAAYCGLQKYSVAYQTIPTPNTYLTNMAVIDASKPELMIYSAAYEQAGIYTIQLTGSLVAFPNVTLSQTFTVTMYSPCWESQFAVFDYPAKIETTVLAPANVTFISPANIPADLVSKMFGTDGTGRDVCGSRTFTITASNPDLISQNAVSIDSLTGAVTLSPQLKTQVGIFTATVTLTLDKYANITVQKTITVQIYPCRILDVSMSQPSDQEYTLHPNDTWIFNYPRVNVIQNRLCGYSLTFSFQTDEDKLTNAINLANSTDLTSAEFTLRTIDRSLLLRNNIYDDRVFQISLTVNLIECFDLTYCSKNLQAPSDPYASGNAFQVTTFKLKIYDPCKRTILIQPQIENMHSLPGYTVASRIPYTYTDTVTQLYQAPSEYCGTFNFTCVDTKTNETISELNATQGNDWYFSPPASSWRYGDVNVTVTAYQVEFYPVNKLNQTFTVTTLGYTRPQLQDEVYYVNSTVIQVEVNQFKLLPGNFTAENLAGSYISFYEVPYTSDLYIPIDLEEIGAIRFNDSSAKDWMGIKINDADRTISYSISTSDSALVDTQYKFLLVEYFPQMNQLMFGYFVVQIQKKEPPRTVLPPPEFISPLIDQTIVCKEDMTFSWSYELPKAISSTEGATVPQITGSCASDSLNYAENSRTVSQTKYVSKNFATLCSFILKDSLGNQNKKNFTVSFSCLKKANITYNNDSSPFSIASERVSKQKISPSATITSIDKTGLMTITFNTTMQIPEDPMEIQNGTVKINEQTFRVVEISVLPSKYQNISNLDFVWTFIEFTKDRLRIQLVFSQPNQVSAHKEQDQIKVKIYGNYLFADYRGNYIQPETVLTKALTKQTMKSMADKLTALGLNTQNSVLTVLFTNTIMTVLVAGPINLILGAVKQLQITSHIMLVNLPTPANLNIFFSLLMQLVTLNFIDTTKFVDKTMKLDYVDPYSEQFNEVGYGSLYVFQNLGTLAFIMFGAPPLLAIAYLFMRVTKIQNLENYKTKIQKFLCYDGTISFLYESILLFSICGMLNFKYFHWNTFGNAINSLLCVLFLLVCAVFPIFFTAFYSSSGVQKQIQERSARFLEKFGGVLEGLNFLREGKKVLIFLIFTMYRKIVLSATCVYLKNYPLFSIFSQIWVSIAMVIMLGYVQPFSQKIFNRVEMFNECCVVIHLYHSLCFTDFQPDLAWRDITGFSLITSTGGNIVVNLGVVSLITLAVFARKAKLFYLKSKQRLAQQKKLKIKQLEETRKKQLAMRLEQEERNRQNLIEWEKKLEEEREAIERVLIEQQIQAERTKAEKAMRELQAKEKKLQEKQAKEARAAAQKKKVFDQRGFPVAPPIDFSVYLDVEQPSSQKLVNLGQKTELVYPVQSNSGAQTLGYNFKQTQVAQLEFTQTVKEIMYKPKLPQAPKPKPVVKDQPRKLTQWEKDNPEAARQRDELAKENAKWTKYDYNHYPFMAPEEEITDSRFIGPKI